MLDLEAERMQGLPRQQDRVVVAFGNLALLDLRPAPVEPITEHGATDVRQMQTYLVCSARFRRRLHYGESAETFFYFIESAR